MKSGFILVAAGLAIAAWYVTRATSSSSSSSPALPTSTDNLFSANGAAGGGALTLQQALAQGGPALNPTAASGLTPAAGFPLTPIFGLSPLAQSQPSILPSLPADYSQFQVKA